MKNSPFSIIERKPKTTAAMLYEQLKKQDFHAVKCLHEGVNRHLKYRKSQVNASAEDLEELANDATMLALRKICDGSYSYLGSSPVGFANAIADNLLRNFCRKKRRHYLAIEGAPLPSIQPEVEAYFTQEDLKTQLGQALGQLSEPSRQVIRLRYFEELSDEEIVTLGLTAHRNTDSLKSARCRSLKRLAGLVRH